MNLTELKSVELVKLLEAPGIWQRRTAQRLLSERHDTNTKADLKTEFIKAKSGVFRLSTLWTLHGSDLLDEFVLEYSSAFQDPSVLAWVARLDGERGTTSIHYEAAVDRLEYLAGHGDSQGDDADEQD